MAFHALIQAKSNRCGNDRAQRFSGVVGMEQLAGQHRDLARTTPLVLGSSANARTAVWMSYGRGVMSSSAGTGITRLGIL